MFENLKGFLMRGNVVDLAVGVIIGAAFGKIVSALVDKLIMPIIGIFSGGVNFKTLQIKVGDAVLGYGEVIQATVDFVIIGMALYFLLKAAGKQPKDIKDNPVESLLEEIRDELRKRPV